MSNHITKAQREQWIARAAELIIMDADQRMTNYHDVRDTLMTEFGISNLSAQTASASAARRLRYQHNAAAALGRIGGQSTSEAKQAAARANGKRGGRPRKTTP